MGRQRELKHLNGNMLAVVDVETSGLQAGFHSIVQVCVAPLNSDFELLEGYVPFYIEISPTRKNFDMKAASVSKLAYEEIKVTGIPEPKAADLFDEWFNRLPLPHNKSLSPLAHNWPFDHAFMTDWLGWHNMQRYFHGHYRDLMCAGIYENDKAAFNVMQYPYPKHGLSYYCAQLGVQNDRAHDALQDCIATARCYKRVVQAGMFTRVAKQPETLPSDVPLPDRV